MPALNFQARFADAVETHEKRQTIRLVWKRPIKPGVMLYLYTGMRTKHCRMLRTAACLSVRPVTIDVAHYVFAHTMVAGKYGGYDHLNRFAKQDGFDSWKEMRDWFDKRYGLPFEGVLITW